MVAGRTKKRSCAGFSIVNTIIAVVVVSIAAIGTSRLRYYSTLDSRRAETSITAARAAELIGESWRAVKGVETYDPVASLAPELNITEYSRIAPLPSEGGFTESGAYKLVLNEDIYYATLSWQDVSDGLRALNVTIGWAMRSRDPDNPDSADNFFELTTYTTTP